MQQTALPAPGSYGVSRSTEVLWTKILAWVSEHGHADTSDSPDFIRHVQGFRDLTVASINRHLRRMAVAGLLKQHRLARRLDETTKQVLSLGSGPLDQLDITSFSGAAGGGAGLTDPLTSALATCARKSWAKGYFFAVASLLRSEGTATVTVLNLFAEGGDWRNADPGDLDLFAKHGLVPAQQGTDGAERA